LYQYVSLALTYDVALRTLISFNSLSLAKRSKPERRVMIVADFTVHPKFSYQVQLLRLVKLLEAIA
jgi:hypothetical protein